MGKCFPHIPFDIFFFVGMTGAVAFGITTILTMLEKYVENANKKIDSLELNPPKDIKTKEYTIRPKEEKWLLEFKLAENMLNMLKCLTVQIVITAMYWFGHMFQPLSDSKCYNCIVDGLSYIGLLPTLMGGYILFQVLRFFILLFAKRTKSDIKNSN